MMVHFCCIPGCANWLNRDTGVSYFNLPLKIKSILRQWIHIIGRKNLPINNSTRVCSVYFINAIAQKLRPNEVPLEKLPLRRVTVKKSSQKPPKHQPFVEKSPEVISTNFVMDSLLDRCKDTQTEVLSMEEMECLLLEEKQRNAKLTKELDSAKDKQTRLQFRLANIKTMTLRYAFTQGLAHSLHLNASMIFLGLL